jgi:hypothetical protein
MSLRKGSKFAESSSLENLTGKGVVASNGVVNKFTIIEEISDKDRGNYIFICY